MGIKAEVVMSVDHPPPHRLTKHPSEIDFQLIFSHFRIPEFLALFQVSTTLPYPPPPHLRIYAVSPIKHIS